ncbi:hypothetical protein [Flavobacterium nitrogenifigens]|uniref:Uncharacterized protein n=1 Tax=Flavobacterium nitrogenifigens TaxID=1617283 RepID=A0A521F7S2_9FLAO|nr:hypothetical protein [Flavobacterium nitrogenifigens]KAF2337788.1 hypothetical protein DM397_03665 [Flavobacterium nitrogenifigens]SMO92187.1 hypothetical protein SAMN06265220_10724 [Flavobacterium nitrogenifigens]
MARRRITMLLLGAALFILCAAVYWLSALYGKMRYDAAYKDYRMGISAENYALVPVSKAVPQDLLSERINFDTVNHKFILPLKHQYYDEQKSLAIIRNCTYIFDAKGVLLSKMESAEEMGQQTEFGHCVKLEDVLGAKNEAVSVVHFHKENCTLSLNPFRGLGSPNGPGRNMAWQGTAYIGLKMQKEVLKLKDGEVSARNFFSNRYERNDYELGISLYRVPAEFQKISCVSFLVRRKAYGPNELYIIRSR